MHHFGSDASLKQRARPLDKLCLSYHHLPTTHPPKWVYRSAYAFVLLAWKQQEPQKLTFVLLETDQAYHGTCLSFLSLRRCLDAGLLANTPPPPCCVIYNRELSFLPSRSSGPIGCCHWLLLGLSPDSASPKPPLTHRKIGSPLTRPC